MTNRSRAASTGGATGPRGDEPEKNTSSGTVRNPLMDTFDDVEMDLNGSVGEEITETQPQEQRGLGLSSVNGYSETRANPSPNMDANFSDLPLDDGSDFMEDPKNLRAPDPREGYVQCWIDWFRPDGQVNDKVPNMLKRGWTPRDPSTIGQVDAAFYSKRKNFDGADMIVSVGMVLCEMPAVRMRRIEEFERQAHERMESATLDPVRNANRFGGSLGANSRIGATLTDD